MEPRGSARCLNGAREVPMKLSIDQDRVTLEMLAATIAHSQIVVAGPAKRLPDGFDDVDVAILDWIAAEGRRVGRSFVRM
jgi:hypothetical protein